MNKQNFVTNSDFVNPKSLQSDVVDLDILNCKSGCKDIGTRKFEFVAKTPLLYNFIQFHYINKY